MDHNFLLSHLQWNKELSLLIFQLCCELHCAERLLQKTKS